MMLTGKQKRYLRSLAVNIKAVVTIGKDGLDENIYKSVKEALKTQELVKIAVLKTCELTINEIIIDILANCNCELVQKIGKTIVVYKQSKEKIIKLP